MRDGRDRPVLTGCGHQLHMAARYGNRVLVREALAEGHDPDVVGEDGLAPLHCAVLSGRPEIVVVLLTAGADVNVRGIKGITPLMLAAARPEYTVMVVSLFAHDADLEARDANGNTALTGAVMYGNYDGAAMLLSKQCDVNAADNDGVTPLMKAVLTDNIEITKLLLAHGANPETPDLQYNTALDYSLRGTRPTEYVRLFSGDGDVSHLLG